MSTENATTRAQATRLVLIAATLGLGAGLYEAAFLRFAPHVPGLQRPDVSYMIWFVAPLFGSLAYSLVGGLLATCYACVKKEGFRTLALAVLWGLTGSYIAASVELTTARAGWILVPSDLLISLLWFFIIFAWALAAIRALRRRGKSRLATARLPLKPWALALVLADIVAIIGISLCLGRPAIHSNLPSVNAANVATRPNIVFVVWDTTRADHLSSYGYTRPTSPNLDHLASQGILFENAISASSWTLPSLATIFTGLLPHQHGATADVAVDEGLNTLAEIVKSVGYETAGFNANNYFGLTGWGVAQGFETYDDISSSFRHNLSRTVIGRTILQPTYERMVRYAPFERRTGEELNRNIFRWYRQRSARPFFLFVNYFDSHGPYIPPAAYDKRFGWASDQLLHKMDSEKYGQLPKPLAEADRQRLIAAYDNCMAYQDRQFGELIRFLASTPEWSNTYVIVTSDHGESFGEHGTYDHGWNLNRELLHVPLIVVGPGVPHGVRISHIVRTRELFPTVIDLALNLGTFFRRTSLRRYWRPEFQPEPFDELILSELIPPPPTRGIISMTTPEWQYIVFASGSSLLYRWTTDPDEKTNLVETPEGQAVAKVLQQHLYSNVESSLRPWRGLLYLRSLDTPQYSVLRQAHQVRPWDPNNPLVKPPAGISQAFFRPGMSSLPPPAQSLDEEILKSLPYNY